MGLGITSSWDSLSKEECTPARQWKNQFGRYHVVTYPKNFVIIAEICSEFFHKKITHPIVYIKLNVMLWLQPTWVFSLQQG